MRKIILYAKKRSDGNALVLAMICQGEGMIASRHGNGTRKGLALFTHQLQNNLTPTPSTAVGNHTRLMAAINHWILVYIDQVESNDNTAGT